MTESDALKKWCPYGALVKENRLLSLATMFVTKTDSQSMADNIAELHGDNSHKCIASDCMMWVEERIHREGNIDNEMIVIGGHCGLINN